MQNLGRPKHANNNGLLDALASNNRNTPELMEDEGANELGLRGNP